MQRKRHNRGDRDYITIDEACLLLDISRPTFNNYRNKYSLRSFPAKGRRTYFSKLEIIEKILYPMPITTRKKIHVSALSEVENLDPLFVDENIVDSSLEGAVAGLSLSSHSADLTIADKKQLIFVRSIPIGTQQLTSDSETVKKDFFAELQKSITSYQDQGIGRPVKHFLIGGLPEGLVALDEEIKKEIPGLGNGTVELRRVDPRSIFSLYDQAVDRKSVV